jgi:hypothetical protein
MGLHRLAGFRYSRSASIDLAVPIKWVQNQVIAEGFSSMTTLRSQSLESSKVIANPDEPMVRRGQPADACRVFWRLGEPQVDDELASGVH